MTTFDTTRPTEKSWCRVILECVAMTALVAFAFYVGAVAAARECIKDTAWCEDVAR